LEKIKFLGTIKIYHRTSMNPQEFVRVKQRLQLFHGAPKQVTFAPDGKANMIAGRLYPINVFRSNQQDFVIGFHD
jgi:hypothetical protein